MLSALSPIVDERCRTFNCEFISVQLTSDQETELADIAQLTARTTDEVAQEAVARFLEAKAEHIVAIARAHEQVRLGLTTPHDEVFAQLKQCMGW